MRLNEKRKSLAIITFFIILNTISIVFLHIVVNTHDNIPPIVIIKRPTEGENLSGTITINFTATDQQGVIKERLILIDAEIIKTSSFSYT